MLKRKTLSVVLSLCMIVSLFLGNAVTSNAAENTLDSVTVTGLTSIMEVGGSIADTKATFDAPEGCIADSHWHMWDADANDGYGEWVKVSDGTFTETDLYYLCMTFNADEGYNFSEDFEVIFPEGLEGNVWSEEDEAGNITYHCDMPVSTFARPIYKIDVTSPEVKAGAEASLDKVGVTFYSSDEVVTDGDFEISVKWICTTDNYTDVTGKVFEEGHAYQLEIDINAGAGYYFADTLVVDHNGEINDFAYDTPTHIGIVKDYTLLAPLDVIEIASRPAVKAGETMVEELEVLTAVEDYDCEVLVEWYDEEGNDTAGEVMEAGHKYTLQIEANFYGSTPMAKDFIFMINGIVYVPDIDDNGTQAFLYLPYDLSGDAGADDYEDEGFDNSDDLDDSNDIEITGDDSDNSDAPKTGDSSMMLLWALLAVTGMGTVVFVRRRQ